MMPSNHLILCHPLVLLTSILPSIKVFSSEQALCITWPEYWSFSIGPSNEYSGLISFSVDLFDLLESSPVVDSFFFYLFLSSSQLVPRIKALSVPQQQMAFISTTFPTAVNLFLEVGKRGIFSLL